MKGGIDFSKFPLLWTNMKGDLEVMLSAASHNCFINHFQEELEIREEFAKLDTDNSGFITRGKEFENQLDCQIETDSTS